MLGRSCLVAAALVSALLFAPEVSAQQGASVDRLAETLRNGTDFRVRTQAALALGASKNAAAVKPLCGGLTDPNTTVRAAAAAALGKLALGGSECLKARLAAEQSEAVRAAIQKAIEFVQAGPEPVFDAGTKMYIQLGNVIDKSGRSDGSVDRLFRGAFRDAASAADGVLVAPMSETPARAKQRLAPHKNVRGFFLAPTVPAFEYSGGALTVKVSIVVFSYPGRVMLGTFTRKASITGVEPGDTASENELLAYIGESALKILVDRAAQFQ